ncbi:hypothetical protein [Vulcanisaeta distributa]|uniref:hypothetical protein n=1 Tax=Vulcanisaeta distributa TaxID=164451 RepID=UPI0006D2827E|nr:hypothetical protein [Vulcanisaeta distributa]
MIVIGPSSLPVVNVFYPAGGSSYPNNQNGEGKSPEPVPYSSSGLMYYGMFQSSAYLINYLLGTGTFYLTPASLALYATEHVVTYDYFLTRAFGYYFYSDYPLNPVASLSTSNHFVNIYVFAQRAYREVADAALNVTIDGYSLNAATGGDSIGRSENYIANQPIQQASLFSFSQGSIDLLQSLGKFNWVSYNVSFSWSATVYATDFVIVQAVTTLPNGQSTSIPVQYWNPTISISLNKVPSQWKSLPFYSNFARGTVVSNGQVVSQVAWLDQNDQPLALPTLHHTALCRSKHPPTSFGRE